MIFLGEFEIGVRSPRMEIIKAGPGMADGGPGMTDLGSEDLPRPRDTPLVSGSSRGSSHGLYRARNAATN